MILQITESHKKEFGGVITGGVKLGRMISVLMQKGETMGDYIFKIVIGILSIIVGCTYDEKRASWFVIFMLICGGINLGVGLHEVITHLLGI